MAVLAPRVKRSVLENTCVDTQKRTWTFGSDVLEADLDDSVAGGAARPDIIFLHTATGLGINRTFWRPMFRELLRSPHLRRHRCHAFDWICTGDARPKPDMVSKPFTPEDYANQLCAYIESIYKETRRTVILVVQGSAETIALTYVDKYKQKRLAAVVFVNGLSPKYLEKKPSRIRSSLLFRALLGAPGDLLYKRCNSRSYIESFSLKNILIGRKVLEEYVSLALAGAADRRVRFGVYSFFAGYFFGDYRMQLAKIRVPTAFFCGDQTPSPSLAERIKSVRLPLNLFSKESTMREVREPRILFHRKYLPETALIKTIHGAGPEIPFESPDLLVPALSDFLETLQA